MKLNDEARRELAIKLMQSVRGRYIIAQALAVAVAAMKKVPEEFREKSNIADMEILGEGLFMPFYAIAQPGFMGQMLEEMMELAQKKEENDAETTAS